MEAMRAQILTLQTELQQLRKRADTPCTAHGKAPHGVRTAQAALECWTSGGKWKRMSGKWRWMPHEACMPRLANFEVSARRPSSCPLAGKRVLFLGDSLSGHMYAMLSHLFSSFHPSTMELPCDSRPDLVPRQAGCHAINVSCPGKAVTMIAYVRTDHLSFARTERYWSSWEKNVLEHPINDAIALMKPTDIVLNRGAHFAPDDAYMQGWKTALSYISHASPQARVMIRNTPSGHPHCEKSKRPLLEPPAYPDELPHHWGDFVRQNDLLKDLAVREGLLNLDVATPTRLRPDMHSSATDCLHYNLQAEGNAVETWVRLFLGAHQL